MPAVGILHGLRGGLGAQRQAKLLKQQGEAPNQHRVARDLAALEALPLLLINLAVAPEQSFGRLQTKFAEGFGDRDAFSRTEIQQSVVQIEKNGLKHGGSSGKVR